MLLHDSTARLLTGIGCAAALCAGALFSLHAQPAAPAGGIFTAADANKDGFVTRDEMKTLFIKWLRAGDTGGSGPLTLDQLTAAVNTALPQFRPATAVGRAPGPQNQTPKPADVEKMMAALPDKAPAKPLQPRKVLVLAKAAGFVHSCIPLAAKTVEALGARTGAWSTTVTYDAADITEQNLKQYDALFLDNTTGAFLDDLNDAVATAARKKALLEFVRSGKGLAGIHAAADAYHDARGSGAEPAGVTRAGGPGARLAAQMLAAGDTDKDQKLSRDELSALADGWFDKLDTEKAGRVSQADFVARFASVLPTPPPPAPRVVPQGRDPQVGTWLEFDTMIGGFFKFHWVYPQLITTRIDDPKSPLTAMFHGQEFEIHDETYTFGMDTWSRTNLHILTSIDYDKMSQADKAKEEYPRADHDYGLSWIRREGKGRVFYEAHGHGETVYAIRPMLEHVLAGVQYALGDLEADDRPSVRK
jgi:type 1 glutamine amidotransferase